MINKPAWTKKPELPKNAKEYFKKNPDKAFFDCPKTKTRIMNPDNPTGQPK